jgi:type I restriction enzyme S subunit
MFDSQGGELPVGWEAGSLRDLATEVRDSVRPEDIPPGTPYFGLEHLPKRSVALDDWAVADAVASGKSRFVVGDILFGKLRPYFHKVGPPPVDGVCSTDIVVVRPRVPELFSLVLGHVSSREFVEFTNAASSGTRMPRTTWRDMAAYPVAIPPRAVSRAFDSLVRPMVERMHRATGESRALATTRDALLPHLLQGKEGHSFRNPGRQRSPAEVARDMSRLSSS